MLFKSRGKLPAGINDIIITQTQSLSDDADKHEGAFHEPALGTVFAGPVHAERRTENLGFEHDAELLRKDPQTGSCTVDIFVPVVGMYPLPDEVFTIHDCCSFPVIPLNQELLNAW